MSVAYYWAGGEFILTEASAQAPVIHGEPALRLSFTEFRDLLQCRARGGLISTCAQGRPRVVGLKKGG